MSAQIDAEAQEAAIAYQSDIAWYVNKAGSDTAPGSDPTTPFQSLDRAVGVIPSWWSGRMTTNIAPGTFSINNLSWYVGKPASSLVGTVNRGSPALFQGAIGTTTPGTESAGGSTFVLTDAVAALAALKGMAVRVVSSSTGSLVGQRRTIESVVGAAITVALPFAAVVPVGTTFVLEPNATFITWAAGGAFALAAGHQFMGLKDLTFVVPAGGVLFVSEFSFVDLENVTIDLTAGGTLQLSRHSTILPASNPGPWSNDQAQNPFSNTLRNGCGLFLKGAGPTSVAQIGHASLMTGTVVTENMTFTVQPHGHLNPAALQAHLTTFTVDENGRLATAGNATHRSKIDGQVTASATTGALNFLRKAAGDLANIDVLNSGGDGIQSAEDSYVKVGAVGGTGNVGVGLHALSMGRMNVTTAAGAVVATVTGTAGNTKVDAMAVDTYAALFANGGRTGVDGGGNVTMSRIGLL